MKQEILPEQEQKTTRHALTVKLSLLGVNSLGAGACADGGGEGGGVGLDVQAGTLTSGDLWPSELRALSSSLRPKGSSEDWLVS